jgi:hypothetical protein
MAVRNRRKTKLNRETALPTSDVERQRAFFGALMGVVQTFGGFERTKEAKNELGPCLSEMIEQQARLFKEESDSERFQRLRALLRSNVPDPRVVASILILANHYDLLPEM